MKNYQFVPVINRRSTKFLAGLVLLGSGYAGSAAAADGWYVGAEAGVALAPTIRFDANANTWHQQQDPGYAVFGQVGYGFGQVRLEGELGFRQSSLKSFNNEFGNQTAGGQIGGGSAMANLYYDFRTNSRLTPFLGAGAGALDLAADKITADGIGVTKSSQTVFAYQGIAGLSYALDDGLLLKADYRYQRSAKADLSLESGYGPGTGNGVYAAHMILVGVTMAFPSATTTVATETSPPPPPARLPPPPPPPAPKPAAVAPIARNFMLFFDWDQSVLTPEAQVIVKQAVEAMRNNHSSTIAVTGYTDSSGTVPYNLKLSVRRGDAVKKMLIDLGVPAAEISVVGKGEADQLVPTKDGVREAQNRRVTIILQ